MWTLQKSLRGRKQKHVEYGKEIIEWEKPLDYRYEKHVLKNTDLEHYFDEEYQDVLKNQFWRYEFEWKKVENYTLKKL